MLVADDWLSTYRGFWGDGGSLAIPPSRVGFVRVGRRRKLVSLHIGQRRFWGCRSHTLVLLIAADASRRR
jgi:hypothetical protein